MLSRRRHHLQERIIRERRRRRRRGLVDADDVLRPVQRLSRILVLLRPAQTKRAHDENARAPPSAGERPRVHHRERGKNQRVQGEHAQDHHSGEHAERTQRHERRQRGRAERTRGRQRRHENRVQRAFHRVPDPVRQRRGLSRALKLVEGLMKRVHEHEDVVRADPENNEDDQEVDELEEDDLAHDAEQEKRDEDGAHGHAHRRERDQHAPRVVRHVHPDADEGQDREPQVLIRDELPLFFHDRLGEPVHLDALVRRRRERRFALERRLQERLFHPKVQLQLVADLDDEVVPRLALRLLRDVRVSVPRQRKPEEVKALDVLRLQVRRAPRGVEKIRQQLGGVGQRGVDTRPSVLY